jgi:hypothetical protein
MDESEAHDHGAFNTYDEALKAAKKIVLEQLEHNWTPGISPDELLATYNMYGKDPVIFPPDDDHPLFSAWEFAETIVEDFCEKKDNTGENIK